MSTDVAVQFLPGPFAADVPRGTTLLDAARKAGAPLEAPCDGSGVCGKCLVALTADGLNALEPGIDVRAGVRPEDYQVLACQARVRRPITVGLPSHREKGLSIVEHGQSTAWPLAPLIRIERTGHETSVWAGEHRLATRLGTDTVANLGIAVDIGTTTLVVALVDLATGVELAVTSALNPQTEYGHDVLSRIRVAAEPDGLGAMQAALVRVLNQLTDEACRMAGVSAGHVHEAVLGGNTCMLHIAAGIDPSPLGRAPYAPSLTGGDHLPAAGLGLNIAQHGLVYLPPVVSGFIGADITAGILATDLHRAEQTTVLLDIGTNGEMVLVHQGHMWATSTAAGPAFEGVNITCGMRAAAGAIDGVAMTEPGRWGVHTIDDAPAVGICGSGLIDVVGWLVSSGAVAANGRFDMSVASPLGEWSEEGNRRMLRLSPGVVLTQKDVRQVQLAKAAVRAGLETLLAEAQLEAEEVQRVLIAGSFGYHLRPDSLAVLGLLPPCLAARAQAAGNTCKAGAVTLLTNDSARRALEAVTPSVEVVDLASDRAFEERFIREMAFRELPA